MKVALLGTGLMGAPMARRLLAAGHELTVFNRTAEKAKELASDGARVAATPSEAVHEAEAVLLMLLDGEVVEAVLFGEGVAAALAPGALVIDMSTIEPHRERDHAHRLAELGHAFLDAPVSGGTRGAANGTLRIMVGGRAQDFSRAQPLLRCLGEPRHVGDVGSGQLAKAANQLVVAITIGAVAEALTLVQRAGGDPVAVRDALLGGFADSRILNEHGDRMLRRDFTPGALVSGQLKDLRIVAGLAAEHHLELPLSRLVTQMFSSLDAGDNGGLDHSALLLELERLNPGDGVP